MSEVNDEEIEILAREEDLIATVITENTEFEVIEKTNYSLYKEEIGEIIQQTLTQLSQEVSQLHSDFKTKIKYDESKERIITSLHNELQEHREDLYFKILRSLALDILSLYDVISTVNSQPLEPATDIASFLQDIEDILARHDFEVYQHDGNLFDRKWQKVQKTVICHQSELNGCIAERLRKGLRYGDRVVRPELVTVYRYVNPEIESEKSNPETKV